MKNEAHSNRVDSSPCKKPQPLFQTHCSYLATMIYGSNSKLIPMLSPCLNWVWGPLNLEMKLSCNIARTTLRTDQLDWLVFIQGCKANKLKDHLQGYLNYLGFPYLYPPFSDPLASGD